MKRLINEMREYYQKFRVGNNFETQLPVADIEGRKKIISEIEEFHKCNTNIHPSLLPSFKGARAIKDTLTYGAKVSGVTVHFVNEHYDAGPIVLQRCVPVKEGDTPDTLAARVLVEEHKAFPEALQLFAEERISVEGRQVHVLEK